MADITTDFYYQGVALVITDADGDAAPVDGVPVWASSDETVLSVTPAADGMSADISTVAPGTARITVSADADMGSGVQTITGATEDINVTNGNVASVMTLVLPTPVAKP